MTSEESVGVKIVKGYRDEFDFDDLTVIQIPVKYKGEQYLLCEADGEAGTRYRNAIFAAVRATKGGESFGVEGLASTELLLVHLCLYVMKRDETTLEELPTVRVSESIINRMPSRIAKKLFDKAEEISELKSITGDLKALRKQRDKLDENIQKLEGEEESPGNE